jgi:hypothetical protein
LAYGFLKNVYVDNMVILSKYVKMFKQLVNAQYLMEDLGPLKHLLRMKIEVVGSSFCVTQDVYLDKILSTYGMRKTHTLETLFVPNTQLLPAMIKERDEFKLVGIH